MSEGRLAPASALTGARLIISHFRCPELPAAAPRGLRGGPGTSSPTGECPLWGDADQPFTLQTCPQGMELSTRRVGMSRNFARGKDVNGCSLQDLCVVSDLTFMSFFVCFLEKGSFFHPARISRNICFCPCVEVRNEPKPPPPHPPPAPSLAK